MIDVVLNKSAYSGGELNDGSSLSKERGRQLLLLENLISQYEGQTRYIDIRNLAKENQLYGKTDASAAIRTFATICRKLGLITSLIGDELFDFSEFFTSRGKAFLLNERVLEATENETSQFACVVHDKAQEIRSWILIDGIQYLCTHFKDHNVSFLLKLLSQTKTIIFETEFLYALHLKDQDENLTEIARKIKENRIHQTQYTIRIKDEKKGLTKPPTTLFSYTKALMLEADLIRETDKGAFCLNKEKFSFLSLE